MVLKTTRRAFLAGTAAVAAAATVGIHAGANPAPAAVVTARRQFFGSDNVHPQTGAVDGSKVILSWFGVTGFAMAIGGQVVLLDAWVPRGEYSDRVPTTPAELATLAPTHIFIGHGHFDHAADAAEIAVRSGATVVGTTEHCHQIAEQASTTVRTVVVDEAAPLTLPGGVTASAMLHRHSALRAPDGEPDPLVPAPDLSPAVTNPPTGCDVAHLASHLGDEEGGSLLYQFRIGDFVLTWHDSSGPLATDAPGLLEAMAALPASSVQIGSIQGYNQYTNGLRDPLSYMKALRPKVFVPCHHDNWLPPVSAPAREFETPLREAIATLPTPPELRMLTDPGDYIRPAALTFDI